MLRVHTPEGIEECTTRVLQLQPIYKIDVKLIRKSLILTNYDDVEMAIMVDRIKELKEYKRAKLDLPKVKPLSDLKDWRTFFEVLCNRLAKQRGAATVPLSYVFRTNTTPTATPNPIVDYDDMMCATLEVSGAHFQFDNKVVWGVVKGLTVEGPP
jgi:hypothetical protein